MKFIPLLLCSFVGFSLSISQENSQISSNFQESDEEVFYISSRNSLEESNNEQNTPALAFSPNNPKPHREVIFSPDTSRDHQLIEEQVKELNSTNEELNLANQKLSDTLQEEREVEKQKLDFLNQLRAKLSESFNLTKQSFDDYSQMKNQVEEHRKTFTAKKDQSLNAISKAFKVYNYELPINNETLENVSDEKARANQEFDAVFTEAKKLIPKFHEKERIYFARFEAYNSIKNEYKKASQKELERLLSKRIEIQKQRIAIQKLTAKKKEIKAKILACKAKIMQKKATELQIQSKDCQIDLEKKLHQEKEAKQNLENAKNSLEEITKYSSLQINGELSTKNLHSASKELDKVKQEIKNAKSKVNEAENAHFFANQTLENAQLFAKETENELSEAKISANQAKKNANDAAIEANSAKSTLKAEIEKLKLFKNQSSNNNKLNPLDYESTCKQTLNVLKARLSRAQEALDQANQNLKEKNDQLITAEENLTKIQNQLHDSPKDSTLKKQKKQAEKFLKQAKSAQKSAIEHQMQVQSEFDEASNLANLAENIFDEKFENLFLPRLTDNKKIF